MQYLMYSRWGRCEREPTLARMQEVLSELDSEDEEHAGVSLIHESELSLAAYPGGLLA